MKKIISISIILLCLLLVSCGNVWYLYPRKTVPLEFPFGADEVSYIEMFRYTVGSAAVPEKKTLTDNNDIQNIFDGLNGVELEERANLKSLDGSVATSFRFYMLDGTYYECIHESHGVRQGILSFSDNSLCYYVDSNIGGLWQITDVENEMVDIDELPQK